VIVNKLELPCKAGCYVDDYGFERTGDNLARCTLHRIYKVRDKNNEGEKIVGLIEWDNGDLCVRYISQLNIRRW